jgi:hypothetical protein
MGSGFSRLPMVDSSVSPQKSSNIHAIYQEPLLGNLGECATESAPMLEFWSQGSNTPEPPWLVLLSGRNMPNNEWKFVLHLLLEK